MGRTSTVSPEGRTFHWSAAVRSSTLWVFSAILVPLLPRQQTAHRQGELLQNIPHILLVTASRARRASSGVCTGPPRSTSI